jgi:photosystem II stability/assembly factor-like uncharacterized protein
MILKKLTVLFLLTACFYTKAQTVQIPKLGTEISTYTQKTKNLPSWARQMYSDTPNIYAVQRAYQTYYLKHPFKENNHTRYYDRWIKTMLPFADQNGQLNEITFESLKAYNQKNSANTANTESNARWVGIGPFDFDQGAFDCSYSAGSVQIYSIKKSTSNPNIIYCGTATAGIWKSVDTGNTWKCISLQLPVNSVQSIAIHPNNPDIVYFGGNNTVYLSMNGGVSWNVIGGTSFNALNQVVFDIKIHPNNPNILFVGTQYGLYRSYDQGLTLNLVTSASSSYDYFDDIEFHPTDTNVIYAIRNAVSNKYTQFYKSTDLGVSFQSIATWPVNASNLSNTDHQKIAKISVTNASPNRIYALLAGEANGGSGLYGFYVSNDQGNTWSHTCCGSGPGGPASSNNINFLGYGTDGLSDESQVYYNLALQADPNNPNLIHSAGVMHWYSSDAGLHWTNTGSWSDPSSNGYIHSGIHDISIQGNEVWVASDGGNFVSIDSGKTTFIKRNFGIQGAEFRGFGQGFKNGNVMIGGTYHNSTMLMNDTTYLNGWVSYTGSGDGIRGFVNPGKPNTVYHDNGKDQLVKNRLLPFVRTSIDKKPNASSIPGESCPIKWDPRCYNHFYTGNGSSLWKTEDDGNSWIQIKDFGDGLITDIEVSWENPQYIYVVQSPSNIDSNKIVWKTNNGGGSWTKITPSDSTTHFNNNLSMDITMGDSTSNEIWLSLISTSILNTIDGYKVFYSADGGMNWTNWTTPKLNNHLITNIEFYRGSNGGIYLATNKNIFYRNKNLTDWIDFGNGLPLGTSTVKIIPWYKEGKLRIATNRGIFETPVYQLSNPVAQISADKLISHCLRDTLYLVDYSAHYKGSTFSWNIFPAPAYISNNYDENPKVLFNSVGTYSIALTVTDSLGISSKSISNFYHVSDECFIDTSRGNALQITSNGQRMVTPSLNLTTDSLTFMCWVKPSQIQNFNTGIIFNYPGSTQINTVSGLIVRNNNELGYYWKGNNSNWSSGLFLNVNEWAHVAMVVTKNSVTIYKNGIGRTHNISIDPSEFKELTIGSFRDWDSRTFKGFIDEVCIYNRAISENEIRDHMHLIKSTNENKNGLLAYYQFNENSGLVLDRIHSYHGSLVANAGRSQSTAPIGLGLSEKIIINHAGSFHFNDAKVFMKFPSNGTYPNGQIVVSKLNGNPDFLPNHSTVSPYYWIVDNYGTNNTFSPLDSLVFEDAGYISGYYANNLSNISYYTRNAIADGQSWAFQCSPASIDTGNVGNIYFDVTSNITSLGQSIIDFKTTTLPITWKNFSGEIYNNNQILLNWSTETEINCDRYSIERSVDGKKYQSIGTVSGKGNTNIPQYYRLIDDHPNHGINYYRIKQIDYDGSSNFSKTISVTFKGMSSDFVFFPSPLNQGQVLHVDHSYSSLEITVFDDLGRIVLKDKLSSGQQSLDTKKLKPGSYFIQMDNLNGLIKKYKLIIQ